MTPQALLQQAQTAMRIGDYASAKKTLNRVTKQFPKSLEAWFTLGQLHGMRGEHGDARRCFTRVIALNPQLPEPHFNLGLANHALGETSLAVQSLQRATLLNPNYAAAWYNLGSALLDQENFTQAEQAFLKLLHIDDSEQIYFALGVCAQGAEQFSKAIEYYRQALNRGNTSFSLRLNLGAVYFSRHDYASALEHMLEAHRLDPASSIAIHNIASCFLELAEIDQAIEYYRKSNYPSDAATCLYALNLLEQADRAEVFQAHRLWGEMQIAAVTQPVLSPRELSSDRRLKIGYLSADFRQHPVAIFLEQVLRLHNRNSFEIHCFFDGRTADAVTERLRGYADHWHLTASLSDHQLGELIRNQGIDILVELGGHTSERAALLACRNAPIQVNYLGHVNTTGLNTVDYRFTDALLDPPGDADLFHVEELVRLGNSFFTYTPPSQSCEVGSLPMLTNTHITFASFNKLYKLNRRTIYLWCKAMTSLPNSRMLMIGRAVSTDYGKEKVIRMFESFGISADRLEFVAFLPIGDYLAIHNRVDLIMDCFPWNGHTTTMQSLWMGVPTVTIAGQHHAGRFGYAIMANLGLPEFIANDDEDFVAKVVEIASQPERLAKLRQSLRQRITQSVLCDHERLTTNIEENYRAMWLQWLEDTNAHPANNKHPIA